jgi:hypothetical protein
MRLATRGVPRDRRAISPQPPSSTSTSSSRAERWTICSISAGP